MLSGNSTRVFEGSSRLDFIYSPLKVMAAILMACSATGYRHVLVSTVEIQPLAVRVHTCGLWLTSLYFLFLLCSSEDISVVIHILSDDSATEVSSFQAIERRDLRQPPCIFPSLPGVLAGASSGLHHDFHDNLYILLRGRKQFTLYDPSHAADMYLNGTLQKVHPNGRIVYKGQVGGCRCCFVRCENGLGVCSRSICCLLGPHGQEHEPRLVKSGSQRVVRKRTEVCHTKSSSGDSCLTQTEGM